jgi:hypothetical protein
LRLFVATLRKQLLSICRCKKKKKRKDFLDDAMSRTAMPCEIIDSIGVASVALKELGVFFLCYWRFILLVLRAYCECYSPVKWKILRNGVLQRRILLEYVE